MTDTELSRIEALAAAATAGPWEWHEALGCLRDTLTMGHILWLDDLGGGYEGSAADQAFIAASRAAVPALCAALREARALLLRLEDDDLVRIGREAERAAVVAILRSMLYAAEYEADYARRNALHHKETIERCCAKAFADALAVITSRGPLARLPADALEAENARLREVLREMVRVCEDDRADAHDLDQARHAARKALGEGYD